MIKLCLHKGAKILKFIYGLLNEAKPADENGRFLITLNY
jgi:hypothetical protein